MLLLYEVFFSALVEQYALLIQHVLYGSPDLSVIAPLIMPALVTVSAYSWENLTRKTDWHYVNGVHISLSEGCTASGIQGTDLPPCIPIVRFIDKGASLCASLSLLPGLQPDSQ